jgi:tetratricopeptide (TPR) repeat protein
MLVLDATVQWANALRARGEYDRARDLTAGTLSQLRVDPNFGDDHNLTIQVSGSYAADLRIVGEYRRALEIAHETYRRCAERFGTADSRTAISQHNLGVSQRLMGDFVGAEAVDRSLLAHYRQTRGEADWRTRLSVHALAEDLYGLGRYTEVLDLPQQEYDGRQPVDLGALLSGRTVALARRGVGEAIEALELLRLHLRYCVELFGPDHEHSLAGRMSLATTLLLLNEVEEAYRTATSAAESYRATFGPRNPLTIVAGINLANILRARGDLGQARRVDAVATEALRDILGEEHPFTVAATIALATDYSSTGRDTIARRLSERAYHHAQRAYGADHPATLIAGSNLVLDLTATGEGGAGVTLRDELAARWDAHPQRSGDTWWQPIGTERAVWLIEPPSV